MNIAVSVHRLVFTVTIFLFYFTVVQYCHSLQKCSKIFSLVLLFFVLQFNLTSDAGIEIITAKGIVFCNNIGITGVGKTGGNSITTVKNDSYNINIMLIKLSLDTQYLRVYHRR